MASRRLGGSVEGSAAAAVRLFAGFAGFGAGSVNLAVSSSLLAEQAGSGDAGQEAFGVLAGLWGAALILGTVISLNRGRFPAPVLSATLLLVASGIHVAAIWLGRGPSPGLNLSHLTAMLLTLIILASAAWLRRKEQDLKQRRVGPQGQSTDDGGFPAAVLPGRLLLAAFAGAVLVAGIATPGLAASTAGQYAVPHGQHGEPTDPTGHLPSHHQR